MVHDPCRPTLSRNNKDDAIYEFDRCHDDDSFARWAKRWGRMLCENALGGSLGQIPHAGIYNRDGSRS